MNETSDKPRLPQEMVRALHSTDHGRHGVRLGIFIILYLAAAWTAWEIALMASLHPWLWLLAAPCYVVAAASLHGISLFAHEAVHHTLAKNQVWNAILGAACAIPVLQNCSAYQVVHLRHHQHLGEEGDPDHYANYTRWTWMVFLMNWGRLVIGYPVYIIAIPILGFKYGTLRDRVGIGLEILATVILAVIIVHLPLPHGLLWHGWLVPMVLINFMVNVRGMSQHTLLPLANDEVRGTRSILTNRLVAFFMCNENYHLEHHLYPGVPWYHLPAVHGQLKVELVRRGARYIPSYFAFVREFVIHSWRRSPWGS